MTIFLLFSLVLVLSAESMATANESFHELLVVLQWPTSYCNTGMYRCYTPIPPDFKVHGLWHNKNGMPVPCRPNSRIKLLYPKLTTVLRGKLDRYWPNLDSQKPREYLWQHEYETHGYCIKEFRNPVDYFKTALATANDVLTTMRLSSGKPIESGKLYNVQDFKNVVIADREMIIGLRCNFKRGSTIPQLLEIVICTDITQKPKTCIFNYDKNCDKKWKDSEGRVRSGEFIFPELPKFLSSSSGSPP